MNLPTINPNLINVHNEYISLAAPIPLRTLSSAVSGAGLGWYFTFVNRHVNKNYRIANHREDMQSFIHQIGYDVSETVGMMDAVKVKEVAFKLDNEDEFSVFIVVTAGVGNAVDSTEAYHYTRENNIGTINTWIFINGYVTDEALVQSVITATEAKTKVLFDLNIHDPFSNTIATGTSTDSILVAATQQGKTLPYAGTATPLGQLIGRAVYNETKRAILHTRRS